MPPPAKKKPCIVTLTHLHVVEYEEEGLYGEPLEEFKGVQVRGRVLMVVVWCGTRCSLDVRSKTNKESKLYGFYRPLHIHTYTRIQ